VNEVAIPYHYYYGIFLAKCVSLHIPEVRDSTGLPFRMKQSKDYGTGGAGSSVR
jgi:hypothetical protein